MRSIDEISSSLLPSSHVFMDCREGNGTVNNSSLSSRIKLRRKEGTCLRQSVFVENGRALGNNKKEALRTDSKVTMILFFFFVFFDSFDIPPSTAL